MRGVRAVPPPPAGDAPEAPAPAPWWPLAAGIAAAGLLQPLLPGMFAWFLAAIPHELGHATIGCLLGRPSAPAISLAGHAWTGIQERHDALVWLLAGIAAAAAWWQRAQRARGIALAVTAVVLPVIAFGSAAEIAIAAAGHLGELAFAAWCFAVARTGGYTGAMQERIAGAFAGALLLWGNLRLCAGLVTDAAARAHYAGSGSLGLKNDYLVLAEDLCGCRLQSVALLMLVVSLLALPAGLALARWQRARA